MTLNQSFSCCRSWWAWHRQLKLELLPLSSKLIASLQAADIPTYIQLLPFSAAFLWEFQVSIKLKLELASQLLIRGPIVTKKQLSYNFQTTHINQMEVRLSCVELGSLTHVLGFCLNRSYTKRGTHLYIAKDST